VSGSGQSTPGSKPLGILNFACADLCFVSERRCDCRDDEGEKVIEGILATLIAPERGANRVVAVVAGAKRRKINMRPLSTRPLGGGEAQPVGGKVDKEVV
jgi:hypothetical protein